MKENVYDGDTIVKCQIDLGFNVWHRTSLRLARINAPEMNTLEGKISRDILSAQIAGKSNIYIKVMGKEKFGRWLVELFEDENNINDFLIANGYAKPYQEPLEGERVMVEIRP